MNSAEVIKTYTWLADWVRNHIMTTDIKLADFLRINNCSYLYASIRSSLAASAKVNTARAVFIYCAVYCFGLIKVN